MTNSRETLLRWSISAAILGGATAFLLLAPTYRYEWHRVWRDGNHAQRILMGLGTTFYISMASLVLGLFLGLAAGVMRMSRHAVLNQVATVYVELVRGTPLLVQIMVAYFCVADAFKGMLVRMDAPQFFLDLTEDKIFIGIVTLAIFSGAYIAEIVRAAIQSIDKGQTEAALSQGMSRWQVGRLVLFPQALRRMIPPLTGQFVSQVKDSSLLMVIAVPEVTKVASEVQSSTYKTFEVLLPLALLYLAITFPLSRVARRLELRLA